MVESGGIGGEWRSRGCVKVRKACLSKQGHVGKVGEKGLGVGVVDERSFGEMERTGEKTAWASGVYHKSGGEFDRLVMTASLQVGLSIALGERAELGFVKIGDTEGDGLLDQEVIYVGT